MLPLWGDNFRTILDLWGEILRTVLTAPRGHSNLAWGNAPGKTGKTPSRLKALRNNAPNFTLARYAVYSGVFGLAVGCHDPWIGVLHSRSLADEKEFEPRMNANERE